MEASSARMVWEPMLFLHSDLGGTPFKILQTACKVLIGTSSTEKQIHRIDIAFAIYHPLVWALSEFNPGISSVNRR